MSADELLASVYGPAVVWVGLPEWTSTDSSYVLGHWAVQGVFLWGFMGLLFLIDYSGRANSYKISPSKYPDRDLIKHAARDVISSYFVANLVSPLLLRPSVFGWTAGPVPPLHHILGYLILYHIAFDTYFYWSHRLLHHRSIYKYIHKQHHTFKNPVGLSALYAHPIEDLFVNLGSTFIGPVLFPGHWVVVVIYLAFRFEETVEAHSGYDVPWSFWRLLGPIHGGSRRHDWHHSHNTGCFGGFGFWDRVCGTEEAFMRHEKARIAKEKAT